QSTARFARVETDIKEKDEKRSQNGQN
ncbi:hypothetical protein Tco_0050173, partial [Tanacetum coccineum]